jgi:DNA (cytosine-5)-methyltransferase 1
MMRVLDLFSGLGAFSLGLQRAGQFEPVAFCETNPYCGAVLAKHWPDVPNLGDVMKAALPDAEIIVAGWPCQDISNAGLRTGLAGERSGLWREVVRALRLVRPRLTLLENVAALLDRGMGEVLGDLAEIGHDTEWDCIPASHVGAPHGRDRIWIVAHAERSERWAQSYHRALGRMGRQQQSVPWDRDWESALRELRGMDDGTAYGVERVDAIRNALVPQIPEIIGRAILAAEAST